tara:strand:- start:37 stop:1155 length:1119 start_codon:yes stop_codon:yes gene_type:complete
MVKPIIWVIVGTRPECIKQAPVFQEIANSGKFNVRLVGTGQHKELLESALNVYGLKLDFSFSSMEPGQKLPELTFKVIKGFVEIIDSSETPDCIIVQGDTTSACFTAIAAFQLGIKVFHNEAGLRTFDNLNPFPEESNRKIISSVASLHFAPTKKSKENLIREGADKSNIFLVGNSGIDSFFWALNQKCPTELNNILSKTKNEDLIPCLITAHRRESVGRGFESVFLGLKKFIDKYDNYQFIYPIHPNQYGKLAIKKIIRSSRNLSIIEPVDYISLVHLLDKSKLVLTDSGGIQEEAATLGCPTVVCRMTTERTEALDLGIARISGYDEDKVFESLEWAANMKINRSEWSNRPYGNGNASKKICSILENYFF